MKRTAIAVLALVAGCGIDDYFSRTQYPPSPPPDPTAAILAAEKAATQPVAAPHVVVVPFPDSGRRPVDTFEPISGDDFADQ